MSNHFHILLEVPPMPEDGIPDAELFERLGAYIDLNLVIGYWGRGGFERNAEMGRSGSGAGREIGDLGIWGFGDTRLDSPRRRQGVN
jgi:hypothetical protein